jgi:hypothetical protein
LSTGSCSDEATEDGNQSATDQSMAPGGNEDARSRFSASKALFERIERQAVAPASAALPCFYSPRLQRSNSAGLTKPPPPVPPKPPGNHHQLDNGALTPSPSANSFLSNHSVNGPCFPYF